MNKLNGLIATAFVLGTVVAATAFAQEAARPAAVAAAPALKAHVLTRAELDALLAKPANVVVIDVRRPDELSGKGSFPVFLSIQLGDLEKSLDYIPKDRQVVTVSNHAARAGKAADLLADRGFKVAGAIGAEGYEAEGGTLKHIVAPAPK